MMVSNDFAGLRQMKANLKSVDCIIEIHDARISFFFQSFFFFFFYCINVRIQKKYCNQVLFQDKIVQVISYSSVVIICSYSSPRRCLLRICIALFKTRKRVSLQNTTKQKTE